MKMLTVIVPCYNEEDAIQIFYKEVIKILTSLPLNYEILFIDDGSKDKTLKIIEELSLRDTHVKYISFSRNFGKESAMYAGFCNAVGDYVAVMDADLQDPPSLLPEMLKKIDSGNYDSIATRRVSRSGEPHIRSIFARMFYKVINKISDADIVDGARDFRLMKREMVQSIVRMCEYNRFSKGIFGWIGFRTYWLPYENVERIAGVTKWSFIKLFKYAIDGIINFSEVPLHISSWFGIGMTFISFLAIIFVCVRRLIWGDPVDGWASLVCIITLIGGIQLFCIGIMGQYIAKIYTETKHRPHYIVMESNIKNVQ